MKIKFCGAAKTVTGSCHLLTLDDGYTILLDAGLYQGSENEFTDFNNRWLFDPKIIDCLILSHAHIDHSGRIPKLVKDGFKGNILCTSATRDLSAVMLIDSAKIQERDAYYFNKKMKSRGLKNRKKLPEWKLRVRPQAMLCHFFSYQRKNVQFLIEKYQQLKIIELLHPCYCNFLASKNLIDPTFLPFPLNPENS